MSAQSETFGAKLRDAMQARGMSLVTLHERLVDRGNPISVSALSYWRSGERQPEGPRSLTAIEDIERVLLLAPGELASRIGPSSRTGKKPVRRFPQGVESVTELFESMAAGLMNGRVDAGREMSTQIVAEADSDGKVFRLAIRSQVQAVMAPLHEFVWAEAPPHPSDVAPVFRARSDCRLVKECAMSTGNMFAALFSLDRTVPVGQSTVLEFEMEFPDGYPRERACEHITSWHAREIMIWVRFDAESAPDWIEETELIDGVETRITRQLDGLSIHTHRSGFPPGLLSLRWGYGRESKGL